VKAEAALSTVTRLATAASVVRAMRGEAMGEADAALLVQRAWRRRRVRRLADFSSHVRAYDAQHA
jgi:hypothetical protein